ncbi:MAG: phage tail protein [Anaerolineaceae bacterium]|nr:phage tail protein [Anaerolineaceae bacterium]
MSFGRLEIKLPDGNSLTVELINPQTVVGRAPDVTVPINDPQVSRRHLIFLGEPEGVRVMDAGSVNGSFLGEARLSDKESVPLPDGALIRIGQTTIRFRTVEQTAANKSKEKSSAGTEAPTSISAQDASKEIITHPRVRDGNGSQPPQLPLWNAEAANGRFPIKPLELERSTYLKYLPDVYSADDFIGRFLLIFESILSPIEGMVGNIDYYFDPELTPAECLPWLASWFGLALDERWPDAKRRDLIRSAADLYQWRGTKHGLSEFIRLYTGVSPEILEPGIGGKDAKKEMASFFVVRVNKTNLGDTDPSILSSIIELEKPAHASYRIEIIK